MKQYELPDLLIYRCNVCKNIVLKLRDSGLVPTCCARDMELLIPNSTDGAIEKHVPDFRIAGNCICVKVGNELHPHTPDHYIEWIIVHTDNATHIKHFSPEDEPKECFSLKENEKVLSVYAYCNIHGLFRA